MSELRSRYVVRSSVALTTSFIDTGARWAGCRRAIARKVLTMRAQRSAALRMRAARGATAVAIEPQQTRLAMIADNALALGTPGLEIVAVAHVRDVLKHALQGAAEP